MYVHAVTIDFVAVAIEAVAFTGRLLSLKQWDLPRSHGSCYRSCFHMNMNYVISYLLLNQSAVCFFITDEELLFFIKKNSTLITKESHENIRMQYEWKFLNMSVTEKNVHNFYTNQTVVVYTVSISKTGHIRFSIVQIFYSSILLTLCWAKVFSTWFRMI